MKTIQIVYTCDYCKRPIDQLSEDVKAIIPGRIGYGDKFMADKGGDDIHHYHDYCLENLLDMEYIEETEKAPEPEKSEEQGSEATTQVKDTTQELEPQEIVPAEEVVNPEPKGKDKYDLGKMCSLIQLGPEHGWSMRKIADDIGCSEQTVRNYKAKIEKGWWPE